MPYEIQSTSQIHSERYGSRGGPHVLVAVKKSHLTHRIAHKPFFGALHRGIEEWLALRCVTRTRGASCHICFLYLPGRKVRMGRVRYLNLQDLLISKLSKPVILLWGGVRVDCRAQLARRPKLQCASPPNTFSSRRPRNR